LACGNHPQTNGDEAMSKLSRRTLVTSAAALPALALPGAAMTADNPDAELLRLGAKLERIERDWSAQCALDQKHNRAYEAACEAAGLPRKDFDDFEGEDDDEKREHLHAYHKKRQAVEYDGKEVVDADPDLERWNRFHDRMWPLVDTILAVKPQSLAGLAVITRAFALANAEWWTDGENEQAAAYVEASFLGIKPAPIRLSEEA
jgi:hypothetical protein